MKHFIIVILSVAIILTVCACGSNSDITDYYIDDEIFIDNVTNNEFVVFKTHDVYYHANGEFNQKLNFDNKVNPLELNNGEFAVIFGDAQVENGGVAGLVDYTTVTNIISQKKISTDDAIKKLDIKELNNDNFDISTKIIKYTSGDDIYIIFKNDYPIDTTFDIYRNSVFIKSVELLNKNEINDLLEQLETSDCAE